MELNIFTKATQHASPQHTSPQHTSPQHTCLQTGTPQGIAAETARQGSALPLHTKELRGGHADPVAVQVTRGPNCLPNEVVSRGLCCSCSKAALCGQK